jgi:acyl-CoA synthetase (NDP forming)
MVREVKGWPLLAGYRGAEPVDVALLEEVVLRVSQLVGDFPQIVEMDLNPFMAAAPGRVSAVVDARVRIRSRKSE